MKKTLLILLLFITSTAQAERPSVQIVDRAKPSRALTDVAGHLLVQSHRIYKPDVDGHLQVEHSRTMTHSKRRARVTNDSDRMLDRMLKEAHFERELEQLFNEVFGGLGDFPAHEKYEWSDGGTDDVDPSDDDLPYVTITDR